MLCHGAEDYQLELSFGQRMIGKLSVSPAEKGVPFSNLGRIRMKTFVYICNLYCP